MRILHTADLHIGKTVNNFNMLADQKHVLTQMVEIVHKKGVQVVILAGDIYDRAIPTAEAVSVFNDFIDNLHKTGAEIICISGNHDSPERISFAQEILEKSGVHFAGVYKGACKQVQVCDKDGPVIFTLMPFVKPAVVRESTSEGAVMRMLADTFLGQEETDIELENTTYERVKEAIEQCSQSKRQVLVTHYFVTNGGYVPELSDSETHVSVGGLDNVDCSCFNGFHYTALGHIHKPQRMDRVKNEEADVNLATDACGIRGPVVYAGAPIAYSFSECGMEKSVVMVDLDKDGSTCMERIPLRPLRQMRKLKGELTNLIDPMVVSLENPEDYLQITLTNEEELIDPIGVLRRVYPNIMQLLFEKRSSVSEQEFAGRASQSKKAPDILFSDFYELVRGHEMDEDRKEVIAEVVKEVL